MEEIDIEIPSYFLCPISLSILKDPVILSTGITYDRENIENWLFSSKNNTCPITKQILVDFELTPNHTLRRLIQAWCTLNASYGVERFPTPKPVVGKAEIMKIIRNGKIGKFQVMSLQKLKGIAMESDGNKKIIESTKGAIEFLVKVVSENVLGEASDEAVSILYILQLSEGSLKALMGKDGEFVDSLVRLLSNETCQARAYTVLLLKSIIGLVNPSQLMSLRGEICVELVRVLREETSQQVCKAALQILIEICQWGRNKIKAVDASAVEVLIELLLEKLEKRETEMILVILDQLCGCAEGRAALLKHSAGIAIVSKKILRVSKLASEMAVRIVYSVSKFYATASVLQEMLQVGVVSKLCLVLQVDCGVKTKEKAKEILKLHSSVWKNSPCLPAFSLA
ncbi:hypothetical protein ACHQM5_019823 [Ranunculus cassubicifolius]